jgi:hypothetical protein
MPNGFDARLHRLEESILPGGTDEVDGGQAALQAGRCRVYRSRSFLHCGPHALLLAR